MSGELYIVGTGPGAPDLLTLRARRVLEQVDDVVGYRLYLDLLAPLLAGKRVHPSPIGAEVERARQALDLAAAGRRVALVSSGDAGVYGMAGVVWEQLAARPGGMEDAPAVEVVPGVTALLAAAAVLGAPLMHDFAAISLSDLLTPWPLIERRLEAAAAADFVTALYNPASQRRRAGLATAQAIFLAHRDPSTPVGLVRNVSRPGQAVILTTLAELQQHPVDMLTIVVIGNSTTFCWRGRMITRRGYRVE